MDDAWDDEDKRHMAEIIRMQMETIKNNPHLAREMIEAQKSLADRMVNFGQVKHDFVLMIHLCLTKDTNMQSPVGAMIILHNAMRADGERLYYADGTLIDKAMMFINWQYDAEKYPKPEWYEV